MARNVRQIVMPEVDTGALLSEVMRAYLHGGTPSACLARLDEGIRRYVGQCTIKEDQNLAEDFLADLNTLYEKYRKREDELYK